MTDLAMDHEHWLRTRYSAYDRLTGQRETGRHAFDEDAVLTPIFHALTRGRFRERQEPARTAGLRPADPVDAFRRDPLTAPIPVQSATAGRRRPHGIDAGRHRRGLDAGRRGW